MNTGIILLAAGSSSRMGQSKQLLPIQGEPLLLRMAKIALACKAQHVVVVLGANEHKHIDIIKHLPVQITINTHWKHGMGSSIKAGLTCLTRISPTADAAMIMVCDQPRVSSTYLQKMIQEHATSGKSIIASLYKNAPGVPALFSKAHFEALHNLDDTVGAKNIILQNQENLTLLDFPEGAIDLDTEEDYNTFIKHEP